MEGHIWFAFIYCCSLAVCIYILRDFSSKSLKENDNTSKFVKHVSTETSVIFS